MKHAIITICMLAMAVGAQAANYEVKTNVQGMVNINNNITGGNYSAGVNVGTNPQNAVIYTLEVLAQPIKKGRPFLRHMDQIHYALAGLSTNTAMVTDQQLPWVKTISGNGIVSANLVVAYDKTMDAVSHGRQLKRLKNTRIVLKISRGRKLLEKKAFEPSVENPSGQITLTFGANKAINAVGVGATASIGSVEIDNNEVQTQEQPRKQAPPREHARKRHHHHHRNHSHDFTYEVLARPIHEGRPCLQEVERLSYLLSGGGADMDTLDNVKLPWSKTLRHDPATVASARLATGYVLSIKPNFNKKHAHLAKNTMLQLNFYQGDELLASKEYHPTADNGNDEINFKFEENK